MEGVKFWAESVLEILRKIYKVLLNVTGVLAAIFSIIMALSPVEVGVFLGWFFVRSESLVWIKVLVGVGTFWAGWFIHYMFLTYFAVPVLSGAIEVDKEKLCLLFHPTFEAREEFAFALWPVMIILGTLLSVFIFLASKLS